MQADDTSCFCASASDMPGFLLQGLADTFILLGLPFDSPEAQQLNKEIFEAIYYAGLKTSCQLAVKDGAPLGNFQFKSQKIRSIAADGVLSCRCSKRYIALAQVADVWYTNRAPPARLQRQEP